ncbi:DUF1425 domain-containing protein [Cysteiniphilum halobium]|uniref:DUF1425 domain-containing protein n=1 Tax=Cysteiniphilum halobium TaxID=2219059 RepID=UPI000E64DB58|nr:YcfL family protein [Cysteiniphilum halobium]
MDIIKLKYVSVATLLSLGLVGCASRCITIPANATSAKSFGSGFGQLKAMQPTVRTSAGDTLQGKVLVQNKKSATQKFQYQVQWLDKNGFNVGQAQPWTPVEVYGDLQKMITFSAPTPDATSYNISFCRV